MHIKNIHCMIEKLAEYCKCDIEKGYDQLDVNVVGDAVDMLKDLCEAEYYAKIAKSMEKEEEDEKKENEYFLKMLKEEYGEEEGEKRFYSGQPRSRTSGRFMRRGDGRRRGYEEPPYYHTMPDYRMDLADYKGKTAEELRDMDRASGKMYYTDGGNSGGQSGNSVSGGNMAGNSGGSTRGYEDGFDDGQRRGYSEGYEQGNRDGRSQGGNSRYDRAKRGYEETKEKHRGNTPEDKKLNMQEMEKVLNVFFDEVDEMLEDAAPEVKNMVKTKTMSRMQKIS